MSSKANPLFFAALAGSVAAHLLLLFLLPVLRENPPRPPAIEVVTVKLAQQPSASPAVRTPTVPASDQPHPPAEPPRQAVPVLETPVSLEPAPTPPVEELKAPQTEKALPTTESGTQQFVGPAKAELAAGETVMDFAEAVEVASAPAPRAGPSIPPAADTARSQELIEALRARIVDNIRYPPLARSRGWKGTVLLLASLDAQGRLQELTLQKSSGHSVLDQAAAALVRRVTPISNPLGRPLAIEIPIVYELKDR